MIYIFGFSLLLLLGITIATIYMVIKYRRSKHPEPTSDVSHSYWLETIWTLLPTLIVLTMFWYGWTNYVGLTKVPEGAMEVKAVARMWSWQFEYPDGRKTDKLYVPVGQPVKVQLTSMDVLHSFFVPAFRIKKDTVPGIDTYVWFKATEAGSYAIQCAEYCGVGHADMLTSVEALPQEEYAEWSKQQKEPSGDPRGLVVLKEQGCLGCHSLDGSDGIGPSLENLAAHEQGQPMDAEYLRRAIRNPGAEVPPGYDPIMPAFGEDQLSDKDLQAIVDYLLGNQKSGAETPPDGRELLEHNGCLGCHSLDGSESIAPTFKGIGQRQVTIERDGKEITLQVDADYLRRALLQPKADLVKGYAPMMPATDYLSEEEINAIIDYLLQQ
jgi:cytochrome c oxidase subunit 2